MKCFSLTGIPTGRLEEVISDVDVATIARDLLIKWEPLRPYLGLNRAQKEKIRKTCHDNEQQKLECLEIWKEMQGDGATYGAFITAAESAKDQQLADGVRAMLQTNVSST